MNMMKYFSAILFLVIFTGATVFSQTGTLDTSFDGDGIAMYTPGTANDVARDIIALSDTTMLVCGTYVPSGTNHTAGLLMKILEDGTVDTTFGDNGIVKLQYGQNTYAYDMELQSDGKILVGGICYLSSGNSEFFVARFDSDGSVDSGFGTSGHFLSSFSNEEENCYAIALQSDGKIIMAGTSFEGVYSKLLFGRLNANGTLDGSFGTSGYTEIDASTQGEEIQTLNILSGDTIIGFGYGYTSSPLFDFQVYMAKLYPDGDPDTGFGTNGVIVPDVFDTVSIAYGSEMVDDTLFVTGFMVDESGNKEIFVTKMNSQGVAYEDFGTDGIVLTQINMYNVGYDILAGGDHKYYVCGTSGLPAINPRDFIILRYTSDGTLDPTFNGDGYTITQIQTDWDVAYALDMQMDGKMILAGASWNQDNDLVVTRYLNDFNPFFADFTADETYICTGTTVNFTDLSGMAVTWSWTFDGGTPSTSTDQNPSVTYNTAGVYDVTLTITDGYGHTTSETKTDYITVIETPGQANTPDGETEICTGQFYEYATDEVLYAEDYEWELDPPAAGTLYPDMNNCTLETEEDWSGDFTLRVRATNMCGDGSWSDYFEGTIYQSPTLFDLEGGGSFCEGGEGVEITLNDSETGVSYELYLDGDPTGIVVDGTGSEISFGLITDGGYYTAMGSNDHCSIEMNNQVQVIVNYPPAPPATPEGDTVVCHDQVTDYTTQGSSDADDYTWYLEPEDAGTITGNGLSATVDWNEDFGGTAYVSVSGTNECGEGDPSDGLAVTVFIIPQINGESTVCDNTEEDYEVTEHDGSTYTWDVTGGEITSGQGTNMVTILWGDAGTGMVSVEEVMSTGCSGTGEMEVLIDDCTGLPENGKELNVEIYPNPATSKLTLKYNAKQGTTLEVQIINHQGLNVYTGRLAPAGGSSHQTIDISSLPAGMYVIRIVNDKSGVVTRHFVKK